MEQELFNSFEMLEQIPTSLMTEITDKPESSPLSELTDHTKVDSFAPLQENNPVNNAANPFPPNPVQPQQMNAGNLITGDMAVGFLDMAVPVLIVLLIEKFNGQKVNKKYLQATADEKKTIAPVLQNYLNSVNFNVDSPLNALLLTVAFIYGTKTIEILNSPQSPAPVKMPSAFAEQQPREKKKQNKTSRENYMREYQRQYRLKKKQNVK